MILQSIYTRQTFYRELVDNRVFMSLQKSWQFYVACLVISEGLDWVSVDKRESRITRRPSPYATVGTAHFQKSDIQILIPNGAAINLNPMILGLLEGCLKQLPFIFHIMNQQSYCVGLMKQSTLTGCWTKTGSTYWQETALSMPYLRIRSYKFSVMHALSTNSGTKCRNCVPMHHPCKAEKHLIFDKALHNPEADLIFVLSFSTTV